MENIYKIQLYLSIRETIAPLFSVVQGDKDTRKIEATILNDDGTPFQNESGITAEYWSLKPDGNGTEHSGVITATSNSFKVIVTLEEQDLIVDGKVYAAIVLKKNATLLATMPFYFKVVPIPIGRHYESRTEYQVIQETIMLANQAAVNANEAARHFPYIRTSDQHWMVWDVNRNAFVDTGVVSEAHSPYVNTSNKHWMVWNSSTEQYVDSGILSESRNPYINTSNRHWMVWDHSANAFVDTGIVAEAHSPYLNTSNQHWMVWNSSTEQYVDSGVSASGADGSVLYSATQSLSDANKTRARGNIDAASVAEAKTLVISLSSISTLPARFPATGTDSRITSDMVAINSTLSVPSAQVDTWTVNTSAGYLTVDGTISGSTNITLYLMKSR